MVCMVFDDFDLGSLEELPENELTDADIDALAALYEEEKVA